MKPTDMHKMCHSGCHTNAPKDWHSVPVMTGDYDLDATIMHRSNKDMPNRLNMYLKRPAPGYGARTGYDSYNTYSGDA